MAYICPDCHLGYMLIFTSYRSKEGKQYLKCPICAFMEEVDDEKMRAYINIYKRQEKTDE